MKYTWYECLNFVIAKVIVIAYRFLEKKYVKKNSTFRRVPGPEIFADFLLQLQ